MSADGGKNDAGAQLARATYQNSAQFFIAHRYVVPPDPMRATDTPPDRPTVQLSIGHHLPRIGHDVGRAIGGWLRANAA